MGARHYHEWKTEPYEWNDDSDPRLLYVTFEHKA